MRALRQFTRDANGQLRDLRGRFASQSRLINRSVNQITSSIEGATGSLKPLATAAVPAAAALAPLALQAGAAGIAVAAFTAAIVPQVSAMSEATEAQEKYTDAVDQYGPQSKQAAEAQQSFVQVLDNMPAATREAAGALLLLRETFSDWSDEVSAFTMVPVTKSLGIVEAIIPRLTPLVRGTAEQFDRLVTVAGGAVNTPGFDSLADRFSVFATEVVEKAVDGVIHFTRVLSEGDTSEGAVQQFMEFARANGPALRELLGNIADAVGTLAEAAADAGPGMLALVSAAAGLVAALPPEVVTVALQLAVALKAVSLAGAGVAVAAGGVRKLRDSLLALQAASVAAGGGLAGLRAAFLSLGTAARASVVVAVVAAVALAVTELSEIGREAPPNIDKLTTSLGQLGRTGRVSGEAARLFGQDLDGLYDAIRSVSDPALIDDVQQGLVKVLSLGFADSTPVKEAQERLDGVDQALSNLVKGGKEDIAAAAFQRLTQEYRDGGGDVADLKGQLDLYQSALDDARFEQQLTAQSMGFFGQQALDVQAKLNAQKQAADGLRQSLIALNQVSINASNAEIALEAAIDQASESAKENGRTLDINTQKGRANRTALNQLASATNEATAAILEQTGSNVEAGKAADRGRQQLIAQAMQMGLTRGEAKALADQILKTPDKTARLKGDLTDLKNKLADAKERLRKAPSEKKTAIKGEISDLERKIASAKSQISTIRDKTVTITAFVQYQGQSIAKVSAGRLAEGGLVSGYASGGGVQGFPHGGRVAGAGTATSDSILALVSDGEFVVRAAAVRRYGAGLFESLNAMRVPDFASAGRPSGGRGVGSAGSQTVNITVNLENRGVIGSQMELDTWLTKSLDNLGRTGRLPSGLRTA